jgi:hypothetical protein
MAAARRRKRRAHGRAAASHISGWIGSRRRQASTTPSVRLRCRCSRSLPRPGRGGWPGQQPDRNRRFRYQFRRRRRAGVHHLSTAPLGVAVTGLPAVRGEPSPLTHQRPGRVPVMRSRCLLLEAFSLRLYDREPRKVHKQLTAGTSELNSLVASLSTNAHPGVSPAASSRARNLTLAQRKCRGGQSAALRCGTGPAPPMPHAAPMTTAKTLRERPGRRDEYAASSSPVRTLVRWLRVGGRQSPRSVRRERMPSGPGLW